MKTGWPIPRVWLLHFVLLAIPLGTLFSTLIADGFRSHTWLQRWDAPITIVAIAAVVSASVALLQFSSGRRWGRVNQRPAASALRWWRAAFWCAIPMWATALLLAWNLRVRSPAPWVSDLLASVSGFLPPALFLAYLLSPLYIVPFLATASIAPDDAMRLAGSPATWPGSCPECGTTVCEQRIALPKPALGRTWLLGLIVGVCAGLSLVGMGWITQDAAQNGAYYNGPMTWYPSTATPITYEQVKNGSAGNSILGQIALTARPVGRLAVPPDAILNAWFQSPGQARYRLWEIGWPCTVFVYNEQTQFADAAMTMAKPFPSARASVGYFDDRFDWSAPSDGTSNTHVDISVRPSGIATSTLLILIVVFAASTIDGTRRRAKAGRRRLRRQCVVCAYPLRGAAPTSPGDVHAPSISGAAVSEERAP